MSLAIIKTQRIIPKLASLNVVTLFLSTRHSKENF